MAYTARVAGIRILSADITEVDEAASITYGYQKNNIYSCSWGPADDGRTVDGPPPLVAKSFREGIERGRGGLGSIYVFATGNGGGFMDNCNFDGYTNSLYTITIGAIDKANNHPQYSETCSAQLAVTYSSSGGFANGAIVSLFLSQPEGGTLLTSVLSLVHNRCDARRVYRTPRWDFGSCPLGSWRHGPRSFCSTGPSLAGSAASYFGICASRHLAKRP